MDLPSFCGSGRLCSLGGRWFVVRPLSADARGSVLAWLDDVLPGQEGRAHPPLMSDPESRKALDSHQGISLLIYLGLRDQGVSFDVAIDLALASDDVERVRFALVVLGRRRTLQPGAPGRDISEGWWGPLLVKMMQRYPGLTPEAIGRLTLDQIDCLIGDGCEDEQPVETLSEITTEDPHATLERLRAEHPDFAATLDEQLGATNGEVT